MQKTTKRNFLSESSKIYIPDEFKDIRFVVFLEISTKVLNLLRRNKIFFLGDLQKIEYELLENIVSSSKPPYPELRGFIIAIQESKNNEIQLIDDNLDDTNTDLDEIFQNLNYSQNLSRSTELENSGAKIVPEKLAVFIEKLSEDLREISEPIYLYIPINNNDGGSLQIEEKLYQYEIPFSLKGGHHKKIVLWLSQNKIYIPDIVENLKIEQFTLTKQLLNFAWSYNINSLKDLRQISPFLLEKILGSEKGPFPEIRQFITLIQYTETEVGLEELISYINIFISKIALSFLFNLLIKILM